MKNFIIRTLLVITLTALSVVLNVGGPLLSSAVETALVVAFVFSTIYLTGRARFFIPITIFASLVFLPIFILTSIGVGIGQSWQAAAAPVLRSLFITEPTHGLLLFVPLVVGSFCAWVYGRHLG